MIALQPQSNEAAVLRRLLDLLRVPPDVSPWAEFERPVMRRALCVAYFLSDVAADNDVEGFMVRDLDRLLQHLTRRTDRKQVEYQGQVRGRVLWPATYKARYTQDYDPSRHVCSEVRNRFDTLENQLVKHLVEHIASAVDELPAVLHRGVCYHIDGRRPVQLLVERTDNIELALHRFRRNASMREVTLPATLTEAHERHALAVKLPAYGAALRLAKAHRALFSAPLDAVRLRITAIGRRSLPLPDHTGDDAEPWLQLAAELLREQIRQPSSSSDQKL
jgi:hypothetical protein